MQNFQNALRCNNKMNKRQNSPLNFPWKGPEVGQLCSWKKFIKNCVRFWFPVQIQKSIDRLFVIQSFFETLF